VVDLARTTLRATLSALRDADFAFTPLLPDDDDPIDQRLVSLGRWAAGFLTGYTQAVVAGNGIDQPVPPGTAEAIKDFAAIAQVDASEDESDEAERELEELIEYMRVAAMSVAQDALDTD